MNKQPFKDFVITILLFRPGVIVRLAEDLSKVTFEGLSPVDRQLVAELAKEAGYTVFSIATGETRGLFKTYLGVQFFNPLPEPKAQRLRLINEYYFSYN